MGAAGELDGTRNDQEPGDLNKAPQPQRGRARGGGRAVTQRSSGQARLHSSRPTVHRVTELVKSKRRRRDPPDATLRAPDKAPKRARAQTRACLSSVFSDAPWSR